jgi:hypothetical protein
MFIHAISARDRFLNVAPLRLQFPQDFAAPRFTLPTIITFLFPHEHSNTAEYTLCFVLLNATPT